MQQQYPLPSRVPTPRARRTPFVLVALALPTLAIGAMSLAPRAQAAEAPVGLGSVASYSVLGGETVTNTGPSVVAADLGVSPGTAITGFPPGVYGGALHAADAAAAQAQADLTTAYDAAAGRAATATVSGDLVGQTLTTGVYRSASTLSLSGTVTLDGQGDPAAVFVFQVGSGLTTATGSNISLINGAQACRVFWQVGSSAVLGVGSSFTGSVLAQSSISAGTGTQVAGRLLARTGAVTLDSTRVSVPGCAAIPPTTTTTVPASSSTAPTDSTNPTVTTVPSSSTSAASASTTTPATGSTTTSPGATTTQPGATTTQPGATTTQPGASTTIPGAETTVPDASSTTSIDASTTSGPVPSSDQVSTTSPAPTSSGSMGTTTTTDVPTVGSGATTSTPTTTTIFPTLASNTAAPTSAVLAVAATGSVPRGSLPRTGTGVEPLLLTGFGLVGGGALIRRLGRRRPA